MPKKIVISGHIGWDVIASDIKKEFKALKPNEEVDIEINSPGGSVFAGIEISNTIKNHKGKTNIIITGIAASMGSYIAMAGDTIRAMDDASFMIHNAFGLAIGDHRALRKTAKVMESFTKILSKSYEKQTDFSNDEVRDLMNEESWYFGDEIKDAGFVDGIIESEKPESKEDALAYSKLAFEECFSKQEKDSQQDLEKVAAYFEDNNSPDIKTPENKAPEKTNPIKKEKVMNKKELLEFLAKTEGAVEAYEKIIAESKAESKTELEKLSLENFLAKSPDAKKEYDSKIEATKAEASTEIESGKISKADAKYIGQIISSGDYGNSVKNVGIDTLVGENDMKNFKMLVANADEYAEKFKSLAAQHGQLESTPGSDAPNPNQEAVSKTMANAQILSDSINNPSKVQ